jgi:hypothetical protein
MKKVKYIISVVILVSAFGQSQAQKRHAGVTVGPMVSIPWNKYVIPVIKTGIGLEATGEYGFSKKSAVLLQLGITSFKIEDDDYYEDKLKFFSVKFGYKYNLTNCGFFLNGLIGTDIEILYGVNIGYASFTLGCGKRFSNKGGQFIDVGMDYINGDTQGRLNIKAAISLIKIKRQNN